MAATLLSNLTDINNISALLFLFFAFFIWPVWVPLATLLPEKVPAKRKILTGLLILGIITGGIAFLTLQGNMIEAKIVENSIQYTPEKPFIIPMNLFLALYGISIIIPPFISTTKGYFLFGVSLIVALVFSYIIFFNTFTSVWCFLAAWLSLLVFVIIRGGNLEKR